MEKVGLCHVCGKPTMQSCKICGKLACKEHMNEKHICISCSAGRKI